MGYLLPTQQGFVSKTGSTLIDKICTTINKFKLHYFYEAKALEAFTGHTNQRTQTQLQILRQFLVVHDLSMTGFCLNK